ncbi:restriction endonuclease [Candidatus Venteria ishoeyi]|uniref:Type III restriction enzyme, res subunit n=1 Tax=Candidatus Venteria ishoeyi TaxID=1899563 RepID=A0A1H6FCF3_9GAMM|nr:DEAD/DEAH box helicase family protein [Candidatus Venteria ishoeyi]SEH06695.1 Type III restriction enzyme%2C res subunit [Candidatus Venteria ishoeyi]
MTTIHNVLEDYRQTATSTRNQGDKFERLMLAYLKTDPLYQEKYSDVWLWSDWPGRDGGDTGIDLVAQERDTGEYCAIQCKFYDPAHSLQKSDIDSFFTASGKAPFSSRLIVSTTDKWGKNAEKALENQQIAVNRLRVQDLAQSPIDWEQFIWEKPGHLSLKPKKQLRPHQQSALEKVIAGFSKQNEVLHKAVDNTVAGFEQADRGKLIMACGTGKTFTSLKIAEEMAKSTGDHGFVLFLVPSISLLSQTLREWSAECQLSLHNFTVCSDTKVGKTQEDIKTHDLALPATTDPEKLASHIKQAGFPVRL